MRVPFVSATLALTTLLPIACSSFDASDSPDGGAAVVGPEGGADGAAVDSSSEGDAGRAKRLYVFGGATAVNAIEESVFEAYAASILADGSLGSWERVPALDVGRSRMTTIEGPDGLLVMAGGNGMALGQGAGGNYDFFRNDVGVTGGDPLASWQAAPSLGASNGRWAAAGAFASGHAYVAGGVVTGDGFTDTILAAPVTTAPPTVQAWRSVGALPSPLAEHGLATIGPRLYALGGSRAGDGGWVISAGTFAAAIGADGSVGSWTPMTDLPKPLRSFGVVSADARVIVMGGEDAPGSASASVFIGTPAQTATQELSWQETTPLTHARMGLCVIRANGRIYAIGGDKVGAYTSFVEVGEVNGTSMRWRDTTPLPGTRVALGCAAR